MSSHGSCFVELQEYSVSRENRRDTQSLTDYSTTSYAPNTSLGCLSPVRGNSSQEALVIRAGDREVGVEAEVGDDEVPCGRLPWASGEVVGGRQDSYASFHRGHDHGEETAEDISWARETVKAP